jgi:hypothetical protein
MQGYDEPSGMNGPMYCNNSILGTKKNQKHGMEEVNGGVLLCRSWASGVCW